MRAYIHASTTREDGTKDTFYTRSCEVKEKPLWWQDKGLSFTASGYGSRIPTRYLVKFNDKWRRVYCRIYSNNGSLYIGKLSPVGKNLFVNLETENV